MSAQANPDPTPEDDATLARSIAGGDVAAFERLMRRHNRRLYRVARSMLRDDGEAEDALQESYLAAYRAIASFRGDAALATWLTRIVVRECTDRLRRNARRSNIVPIVAAQDLPLQQEGDAMDLLPSRWHDETPELALARAEVRALLERRIDELPEDFRVAFVLRAVEELSVEEAAHCLGIPEATVRSRHFRARSLLREAIAQELDMAQAGVFAFDGERCDRIVAATLHALP